MERIWQTRRYHEQQPTTFFEKKGVQAVCPSSFNIRLRNLTSHKGTRKKTTKCTKRNGKENVWRDRKIATWVRKQTRVENILTTIKMKIWSWEGHIMRRTDKKWTKRVTEWQPRNCKRSEGRRRKR